jgi:hypothetical protein
MESNLGTLPLSDHSMGIVHQHPDRIIRIFSRLSDLPAIKSWTNPLTYIADVVMDTISPIRFFTKYVLRHACVAIMDSPSLAVSIIVLFSSTSTQLRREPVIVIDAPQSVTPSDSSVDSSDWESIERAIAARAVAVQ